MIVFQYLRPLEFSALRCNSNNLRPRENPTFRLYAHSIKMASGFHFKSQIMHKKKKKNCCLTKLYLQYCIAIGTYLRSTDPFSPTKISRHRVSCLRLLVFFFSSKLMADGEVPTGSSWYIYRLYIRQTVAVGKYVEYL